MSYLFITHNIGVVEYIADEVAVMQAGRIVEHGTAAEVLARPQHAYTRTLLAAATNHTMIPALYAGRIKFDAAKSFVPVCTLAASATVLVVGPSLPVKTVAEFLGRVKAAPGTATYATPGQGSSPHLATEQFARLAGVSMVHVPYKGAAPAVTDLMGGQVNLSFATLGSVLPHIKNGKLTALAVASPRRSPLLPDVATFAEAGCGKYSADAWYGVLAPAGVPDAVVQKIERAAVDFAKSPTAVEKLRGLGLDADSTCGTAFAAQVEREVATYSQIAKDLNLKVE